MINCMLCGSIMVPRLFCRDCARPADATNYCLAWCNNCQFGRVVGDFGRDAIAQFYKVDGYYTHGVAQSLPTPSLVSRLIARAAWSFDHGTPISPSELAYLPDKTMCDIGCGHGETMAWFKNRGFDPVGVEPDPEARAVVKLPVFNGTAEEIPPEIAARRFGLVLMSHALEHCRDPHAAVTNAKDLLSEHGVLVIEVPNMAAKGFDQLGQAWPWADIPRHLNSFTETSLTKLLQQCGLRVTLTKYTGYTRQFNMDWLTQQWRLEKLFDRSSNAFLFLLQTAFASPPKKYDSVRIHAVRDKPAALRC